MPENVSYFSDLSEKDRHMVGVNDTENAKLSHPDNTDEALPEAVHQNGVTAETKVAKAELELNDKEVIRRVQGSYDREIKFLEERLAMNPSNSLMLVTRTAGISRMIQTLQRRRDLLEKLEGQLKSEESAYQMIDQWGDHLSTIRDQLSDDAYYVSSTDLTDIKTRFGITSDYGDPSDMTGNLESWYRGILNPEVNWQNPKEATDNFEDERQHIEWLANNYFPDLYRVIRASSVDGRMKVEHVRLISALSAKASEVLSDIPEESKLFWIRRALNQIQTISSSESREADRVLNASLREIFNQLASNFRITLMESQEGNDFNSQFQDAIEVVPTHNQLFDGKVARSYGVGSVMHDWERRRAVGSPIEQRFLTIKPETVAVYQYRS